MQTLEDNVETVLSLLEDPAILDLPDDERSQVILAKVQDMFDFASFSRGALGAHWKRFSPEQKEEFAEVFAQLIARSYLNKLDHQSLDDFEVSYLESLELKPTKSGTLRSDIHTHVRYNNVDTPVDYRMLNKDNLWKIYDVKIEGISMVANYRKQYQSRFNDSPEEMIQEIKDKLEQQ